MSEFFNNRLSFQMDKLTYQVWGIALVIWLAVLICAIGSLMNQPFSRRQRIVWIVLMVGVPILGVLAYLPFSIRRDELPTAFLGRPSGKNRRAGAQKQLRGDRTQQT